MKIIRKADEKYFSKNSMLGNDRSRVALRQSVKLSHEKLTLFSLFFIKKLSYLKSVFKKTKLALLKFVFRLMMIIKLVGTRTMGWPL